MKKKILSLILLLAVMLSFALPTFAAYDFDEIRIIDNADFLTEADYATVYTKLCDASRKYGVELFIYTEKSNVEETAMSEIFIMRYLTMKREKTVLSSM